MPLRKREGGGYWHNDKPIATLHYALHMLIPEFNGSSHYLRSDENPEVLHHDWYSEGDSGGDSSGTNYFEIDPEIVKVLHDKKYVEKEKVLGWGHTYEELYKFVLSREGRDELERLNKKAKEEALALLCPGKLSPKDLKSTVVRGPKWQNEELLFEFETEEEEKFEVSPYLKKVEQTKEKRVPPMIIDMKNSVITDPHEVMRRLKGFENQHSFISAPDQLRIDMYALKESKSHERVHKIIKLYRIDPRAVVMLLWEGLLAPANEGFRHEPKPIVQYVLSERGVFQVRQMEKIFA